MDATKRNVTRSDPVAILPLIDFIRFLSEKVRRQSRSLRHLPPRKGSPNPATAGFFRCFRGLCGWGCSPTCTLRVSEAFSPCRYSPDLLPSQFWRNTGKHQKNNIKNGRNFGFRGQSFSHCYVTKSEPSWAYAPVACVGCSNCLLMSSSVVLGRLYRLWRASN